MWYNLKTTKNAQEKVKMAVTAATGYEPVAVSVAWDYGDCKKTIETILEQELLQMICSCRADVFWCRNLCPKKNMGVSENVVYYPKPNGFHDPYPYEKWLFHWEYTLFSDTPICVPRKICRFRSGSAKIAKSSSRFRSWIWPHSIFMNIPA